RPAQRRQRRAGPPWRAAPGHARDPRAGLAGDPGHRPRRVIPTQATSLREQGLKGWAPSVLQCRRIFMAPRMLPDSRPAATQLPSRPGTRGGVPLQSTVSTSAGRILVVDDDKRARDFIVSSLRADGHEVDASSSGLEATRMLGRSWDDLIRSVLASAA